MKRIGGLVAVALVVAACGGGANDAQVASLDDTTATTADAVEQQLDAEAAVLEFAQCMRDSGVPEYPDPELDANGNFNLFRGIGQELGVDRDTIQGAFEQCGHIVEDVVQTAFRDIDQTEFQDNFLEFAACMREKGVDMDDPDFSGGFGPGAGGEGGRGLFGEIDPEDPTFQAAAEECSEVFEGQFPGPGGGPGGRANG